MWRYNPPEKEVMSEKIRNYYVGAVFEEVSNIQLNVLGAVYIFADFDCHNSIEAFQMR